MSGQKGMKVHELPQEGLSQVHLILLMRTDPSRHSHFPLLHGALFKFSFCAVIRMLIKVSLGEGRVYLAFTRLS